MSIAISTLDPQQMRARDLESCFYCGRSYAGRPARPRWAFSRDGRLVGSVHTYHENVAGRTYPFWTADGKQPMESARFEVWRFRIRGRPNLADSRGATESDEWFAFTLADSAAPLDGTLTERQEYQLTWWIDVGPMKIGEQRRASIMVEYRSLLADYRAWRAGLAPDGVLPGRASQP